MYVICIYYANDNNLMTMHVISLQRKRAFKACSSDLDSNSYPESIEPVTLTLQYFSLNSLFYLLE